MKTPLISKLPKKAKAKPKAIAIGLGVGSPLFLPQHESLGDVIGVAERWNRVAEAAYFLAEQRSFEPGRELEDWLRAEKLIGECVD